MLDNHPIMGKFMAECIVKTKYLSWVFNGRKTELYKPFEKILLNKANMNVKSIKVLRIETVCDDDSGDENQAIQITAHPLSVLHDEDDKSDSDKQT